MVRGQPAVRICCAGIDCLFVVVQMSDATRADAALHAYTSKHIRRYNSRSVDSLSVVAHAASRLGSL
jgi:hypothetical protein